MVTDYCVGKKIRVRHRVNSNDITTMSNAKNFLHLIHPSNFKTKADMILAINTTALLESRLKKTPA